MNKDLQETVNAEDALHGEHILADADKAAGKAAGATGTEAGNADHRSSSSADDTDARRAELRQRIAAAENRYSERDYGAIARDTADKAKEFAKEHPFATVAAAAAVGLLIGASTKRGRRAGRRAGRKASSLASTVSDAVLAFGAGLLDDASDLAGKGSAEATRLGRRSGDRAVDLGDRLALRARGLRRDAGYEAGLLADGADALRLRLRRRAQRMLRDTTS